MALACALLSWVLSGCAIVKAETEDTVDYGDVADAVTAATQRVVEVRDLSRSANGFGYRLSFGLTTDSAEPFTADELDAVVEAVWDALPWEPNTIDIVAGADTAQGHEIVDLRTAAEELDPLVATGAGTGGASLTGMESRYGDWTKPE